MIKQSAYVLALLLGTSKAHRRAPESYSYFATGMNGDEDLAEDITMKGDHFHYLQKPSNSTGNVSKPVQGSKPVLGKGCNQGEISSADGNCYFEGEAVQFMQVSADPPEKVLTLDPRIATHHTSFMVQKTPSSLVQLQDDSKHETEKVHALEPIPAQVASNSIDAFPNQRTAFYVQTSGDGEQPRGVRPYSMEGYTEPEKVLQPDPRITHTHTTFYDKKNKLWMAEPEVLAQLDKNDDIAIAAPGHSGFAHEQGMGATEGIANPRNFAQAQPNQRNKGSRTAADPISPEDMDPWVYRYTHDNTSSTTQWHAQISRKPDISEKKMDEEVHGFASDNVDVLPTRFQADQYAPNGSGSGAHKGLDSYGPRWNTNGGNNNNYSQVNKKPDIAEPGMEENVHKFASENVDALPRLRREDTPYPANGGSSGWNTSFSQKKPDIAEPGMEENVHKFASENVDALPRLRREDDPYPPNGVSSGWQTFSQKKPDIAEPGMEENVHKFASENVDALPRLRREDTPYPPNGVSSGYPGAASAFIQRKKKDISERAMDEEVHGFASDNVDVLPTRFQADQYAINGQAPNGWGSVEESRPANWNHHHNFAQKQDIADHEVRPDVWTEVHKMINPTSVFRAPEPPKPTYQASPPPGGYDAEPTAANPTPKEAEEHAKKASAPPEQHSAKKAEPVKHEPKSEEGDLDPPHHDDEEALQTVEEPKAEKKEEAAATAGPVEKVHEIQPLEFQERANTNSPGPRTTFYDKKNALWRVSSELVQMQ